MVLARDKSRDTGKMIGLFFSEVSVFAIVALAGLVAGWRMGGHETSERVRVIQADAEAFRAALSDAQVRRAARSS